MPIFSAGSASVSIVPDFSGAQKAIGEFFARQSDIKVAVKPDVSQPDLLRAQAELNALHGTANIDVDKHSLAASLGIALHDALLITGLDSIGGALTAAIKPTLITALGGALTELAAAASQAVGALALAPAILAGIAAPAAVVAIGVHGIGDAFKAINTGDATKIAAAMNELAPAARDLVTQVHALGPAWTSLRLDVQQNLLAGVGTAVTNLANVALPILHTGLVGIAQAMNGGLLATMTALQGQGANFTTLFTNIAASIKVADGAAAPLVQAFGTLGAVGSQFLPVLAQGFVNVSLAFNNWVQRIAESGQLVVIIQNAIDVLKQLAALAGNLAGLVSGIFTAAIPYGTILLDLLIRATGALSGFVHSADGQSALGTFFAGITTALGTILPALNVLVQAIVVNVLPAIGQFAALLAPIAATLLVQLAVVLNQIGQILPPVATALAGLVSAMAPLIPVVGTIITSLLPPLVKLASDLAPIIEQVAAIVGGALLQAVSLVAPILPGLATAFIGILNALLPLVPPLLSIALQLLPPLLAVAQALVPVVQALVAVFVPLLQGFLKLVDAAVLPVLVGLIDAFAAGLKTIAGWLGPLAPVLQVIAVALGTWTAAQWLLNIALDANPIGAIILAIGLLITAIGFIATHLTEIKAIWETVWGAIKDFFETVWTAIRDFFVNIWTAIVTWFTTTLNNFVAFWQGVWNAVSTFFQTVWNAISSFFHAIWDAVVGWFTTQINNFVTAWQAFWNAIFSFFQTIWNALSSWAQATWTAIATFFTNAWNAFTQAWDNFWNAIFSFFQNLWNSLVSWVQSLWNGLASWFSGVWNAFTQAWDNFWNAIFSFFQGIWNNLVSWIQSVWNNIASFFTGVWNAFSTAWNNFWSGVSNVFQSIWNGIKQFAHDVWEGIKAIIAAPINFVINTILNGGLFKAWNAVNDFLHLPFHINPLSPISLATGGVVPGYSPSDDADNIPANLTAGEFVVQRKIATRTTRFLTALNAGQAEAVQAAGGWDANPLGFAAGGTVPAALDVARSLQGTPYVWGGVSRSGVDCSGFQSVITNALRGESNPFHRVGTTATFPWPGFVNGYGLPYTIGNTKNAFNSGVGHMAGSLDGHAVESGSGHGARVDSNALSATAALFGMHGWLQDMHLIGNSATSAQGAATGQGSLSILGHIIQGIGDVLSWLTGAVEGGVSGLVGGFDGGSKFTQMMVGVPRALLTHLWDAVKGPLLTALGPTLSDDSNTPTDVAGLKTQAYATANLMYGWNSAADQAAIDYIVSHESGWKPSAQNPSSTASGLWQMIDSTWAANKPIEASTYSHMKDAPAGMQDKAGIRYLHDRYGSAPAAQSFWAGHHYYDDGGWLPPGSTSLYNGTGGFEAVLNQAQQAAVIGAVNGGHGPAQFTGDLYLDSGEFLGKVRGVATDVVNATNARDGRTIRSSL